MLIFYKLFHKWLSEVIIFNIITILKTRIFQYLDRGILGGNLCLRSRFLALVRQSVQEL